MHIANVEAYELSEFIPDQFSKNDFGVMCLTRTTQVMQHRENMLECAMDLSYKRTRGKLKSGMYTHRNQLSVHTSTPDEDMNRPLMRVGSTKIDHLIFIDLMVISSTNFAL